MPHPSEWNWEFVGYFLVGIAIIAAWFAHTHGDRGFLRDWLSLLVGITGIYTVASAVFWFIGTYPNFVLALFWAVVLAAVGLVIWANRRDRKKRKE